ncbi:MAG: hypothetical protein ACYTAF_16780, partial [Planctomycetota bacterium]
MTPEQNAAFVALARILRRPGPLQHLMREVTETLITIVPVEGVRYDITDNKGAIWSRVCKPGQDPDRPGLGAVLRLKTREELVREGDQVSLPLGFGERASGRLVAKKSGGFSDEEVEALQHCADLFTLALRARPFEPRPKPRSP